MKYQLIIRNRIQSTDYVTKAFLIFAEKLHQRWISQTFPGSQARQTAQVGQYYSYDGDDNNNDDNNNNINGK